MTNNAIVTNWSQAVPQRVVRFSQLEDPSLQCHCFYYVCEDICRLDELITENIERARRDC